MTSPSSIIEIGIPQVSFDPGGAFITDVEVEFPEASKLILITFVINLNVTPNTQGDVYRLGKKLKCHTEYSGMDCSTLLDMHPLMAIRVEIGFHAIFEDFMFVDTTKENSRVIYSH
ncbi:hypothetical protein Tco_0645259 [Tanacetum coccineum]